MEAAVTCGQEGLEWSAVLRCEYVPGGESTVEVLEPASIAGIKAVLSDSDWRIEYEDACLNAGPLSSEEISPAACLPRLMSALRDGWLLEENEEEWGRRPLPPDHRGSKRPAGRENPLHHLAPAGGRGTSPGGNCRGRRDHFDGGLYELFFYDTIAPESQGEPGPAG